MVPLLIASSLGISLSYMGSYADKTFPNSSAISQSEVEALFRKQNAALFLGDLFYCCMFLSALAIAGSRQLMENAAMTPTAPQYVPQPKYEPQFQPQAY